MESKYTLKPVIIILEDTENEIKLNFLLRALYVLTMRYF